MREEGEGKRRGGATMTAEEELWEGRVVRREGWRGRGIGGERERERGERVAAFACCRSSH